MPAGQISDDTACLDKLGKEILINNDLFVENVHFSQITTSPEDIGWRAVAANIADLASSGANEIIGITVGLVAPPNTDWLWVEGVYKGLKEGLNNFGGEILGGDCSQGTQKIISITAIGNQGPIKIRRYFAKPGDLIITTGIHGLSRLGLAILQNDPKANHSSIGRQIKSLAIQAHKRPYPAIKALKSLEKCKPAQTSRQIAGTDSSDGLLDAIQNICLSSDCQAVLDQSRIPKLKEWPSGIQWNEWCLNGGEDFQLVISLPPEWGKAWLKEEPSNKCIGLMQKGLPKVIWENGKEAKRSLMSSDFQSINQSINQLIN